MRKIVLKTGLMIVVLVITALTLVSCSNPIVGTWTNSVFGLETTFQFNSDGSFSMFSLGIQTAKGTYTVIGNQIKLSGSYNYSSTENKTTISTYSLTGNQLVIDNIIFTRQK